MSKFKLSSSSRLVRKALLRFLKKIWTYFIDSVSYKVA